MVEILLIQPPFATLELASVGLSNFKARLLDLDIRSKVIYSNFSFAKIITPEVYQKITLVRTTSLAGEWIFATHAFPEAHKNHREYKERYLDTQISVPMLATSIPFNDLILIRDQVNKYLTSIKSLIISEKPQIVGLSTTFQQTCAAIAIANIIKSLNPKIVTVLGGGNCLHPMNEALSPITPNIDYIFSGEADFAFPQFCHDILNYDKFPSRKLIDCPPIKELNNLPLPSFHDYFEQLKSHNHQTSDIRLGFESSRGCWWGEKSNCLFCGLNGICIKYRSKSLSKVIKDINYFLDEYKPDYLQATDNIMPKNFPNYFYEKFTPPHHLKGIYYEVKPLFTFEEICKLYQRKINALQPGLESLNDHLLHCLRKGLTSANNIRFLRDCRTVGMKTDWNLLYSIPGEQEDDYLDMIELMPKLFHLKYPDFTGPINVQRYSPLHTQPQEFDLGKIEPIDEYKEIFPSETNFDKLALYFTSKFKTIFTGKIKNQFLQVIEDWKEAWREHPPVLRSIKLNSEFMLVEDTRSCAVKKYRILTSDYQEIIENLRQPVIESTLVNENSLFEDLIKSKYVVKSGNCYISLICEPIRITEFLNELHQKNSF
ncbi:MAG: RiPP maturation radical SAM C-methyltransferase [Candidatus Hodarchaeales archaeon]|jgi:ribosomal peptide maturation radical SAM protein 1